MHKSNTKIISLTKKSEFISIGKIGSKAVSQSAVMQVAQLAPNLGDVVKVGFIVTKKIGNAVIRNRAKRRLRAVFRNCILEENISGRQFVIVARKELLDKNYLQLKKDFLYLLKKNDVIKTI